MGGDEWPQDKVGIHSLGDSGVDIFFVISGFIMLYVNYNYFQQSGAPQRFIVKRLVRIVPLYWVLTTIAVALLLINPSLFSYRTHLMAGWVIGSYLFFPVVMENGIASPVVGPGWTLNYEMYFYLIFSLCLFWPRNRALTRLCFFFGASVIVGRLFHPLSPWASLMTNGQLLEFTAGVLIALAAKKAFLQFTRLAAVMLLIVGWVALVLSSIYVTPNLADGVTRFFLWGIPAALIVAGAKDLSIGPGWFGKVLILLGDASYSIYLFHAFALPACALILRKAGVQHFLSFDLMLVVLMATGIASGVMCWYLIERPMTSYFSALTQGRKLQVT
jgi:peptidoglycan/LPS O-acetylase OafA/YrhL